MLNLSNLHIDSKNIWQDHVWLKARLMLYEVTANGVVGDSSTAQASSI